MCIRDRPDGVTSIGSNAFQNCTSLASVRIPNSVTSLGTYIFDGCSSLTDVTLGKGLTSIPSYMFSNCESLKNIKIPYNVATIGSYAFLNDTAFTEITIPRKTTDINSNAFSYPGKLNIYGISGTYAETFANENNIKFTNREVNASKVELNESQITFNEGDTYNLIMSVTPDDFTDAVTWKSTDTDVVTVTETGVIKAVGTGTATIKLTVGNVSTLCRITVLQPVTSISLDRSSLSLDSADNYQLSAYIYPSTASNKNVVWESSDPSVATIDDNGMVTALKKGTAKITVKAMDGSNVSASCTVTVKNTTYVCDTVDKIESQHNYENECSDSWIYTIEGAECIEVGFDERTTVESGFDYIYIFSADDTMVGKYTGTELAGKTIRIEGSKVRIKLESDVYKRQAQGAVWFSGGGGISYINDDEMFSKYPYYFNDDTYNAMFRNARSEIYDALDNADSSRMLIAIMTALSDGKDLIIKQLLSSVTDGIDSTSDEAIDKATLDFVQTMLGNETFLSSFITSEQSKIKGIKLGYDLFSATGKEAFSKEASTLLGVHKEVFDLQLSKFLDNTGKAVSYTHLDVYKRQEQIFMKKKLLFTAILAAAISVIIPTAATKAADGTTVVATATATTVKSGKWLHGGGSVSYTHLDVYKRQAL